VSSLPVDFVKVTFDDNTIGPAQQALADGELSVFDTYETEYDLIHRPAFSWDARESVSIKPGEKSTITVNCQGRVGWYVPYLVYRTMRTMTLVARVAQYSSPIHTLIENKTAWQNLLTSSIFGISHTRFWSPSTICWNATPWTYYRVPVSSRLRKRMMSPGIRQSSY
jgi:hypothetical protein